MIERLGADEFGLDAAGDLGFAFAGDHVDFAADAEFAGEVEAGFDGEAGVGQDEALVVGFEVVEMRAVAVDFGADVVAGAVGEPVAEAGVADDVAGGVVGLPAGDGLVGGEGVLDGFDGGVAGVADGGEDELFALGGLAVDDAGPGDVVPDGGGVVGELGPDVDEDEVAFADGAGVGGGGLVVRVGGVGAGGDVGAVLPDEAFAGDGLAGGTAPWRTRRCRRCGRGCRSLSRRRRGSASTCFLRDVVGGDLLVGEDGFELADEVGGADDLFAEGRGGVRWCRRRPWRRT